MSCLKRTNVTLEHQRKSWSLGFPVLTRGPDKSSDTVSPSPYIFIYLFIVLRALFLIIIVQKKVKIIVLGKPITWK